MFLGWTEEHPHLHSPKRPIEVLPSSTGVVVLVPLGEGTAEAQHARTGQLLDAPDWKHWWDRVVVGDEKTHPDPESSGDGEGSWWYGLTSSYGRGITWNPPGKAARECAHDTS